ncbi:MAG: hypothetical protein LBN26_01560 [Christensenellaceae bacterium]|nr:hypothetical protein [Christensenellaceae bacterium]
MNWFIFAVIVGILLFILLGTNRQGNAVGFKLQKRQWLTLLAILLVLPSFVIVVPVNSVGIVYSPFSGVSEQVLPEGIHAKGPLDSVYTISTEVQTKTLSGITGQTKDSQYVTMEIDIKYRVSTANAFEVFRQYRNLNTLDNQFIMPTVQRGIEKVTTNYNVIEILGDHRNNVYADIEGALKEQFALCGLTFVQINFNDTDAGAEIENAIKAEAVAKKMIDVAEQERDAAEVTAQQRVIEARADKERAQINADMQILQAEAAAKIKELEAQAQAKANVEIAKSITPELIEMKLAEARLAHGWVTIQGAGSTIVDGRGTAN